MSINWTLLTYFVVGIFVIHGFNRGWWREAVVTFFLLVLLFFLQFPPIAAAAVTTINEFLLFVWLILPDAVTLLLNDLLDLLFGVEVSAAGLQIDAGNAGNWILLLLIVVTFGTILSRAMLPDTPNGYRVSSVGSILGALVGGFNGFLVINLLREYLDGRNLPNGGFDTEIAGATSGVAIQAVDVPSYTILDSFVPWVILIIGGILVLAAIRNRIVYQNNKGFRKVATLEPYGYSKY